MNELQDEHGDEKKKYRPGLTSMNNGGLGSFRNFLLLLLLLLLLLSILISIFVRTQYGIERQKVSTISQTVEASMNILLAEQKQLHSYSHHKQ